MIIKTMKLADLKPAPYNPRVDLKPGDVEYDKLKKDMAEFGCVETLVWNKRSGFLVGGHQRIKVLLDLGYTETEVSVVDLPETKEIALNLALNKISGSWDNPLLKDALERIDTGEFDIEITGFDPDEIAELMNQLFVSEEGNTDDDAVPEAVETICQKGDLWKLGNHRLLCGDATVKADVEKLMDGEKADMVFTDPPYGINIVKVNGKNRTAAIGGSKPYGQTSNKGRVGFDRIAKAHYYSPIIGDDKPFDPTFLLSLAGNQIIFGANYFASHLPDGKAWLAWDKDVSGTFSEIELIWTSFEGKLRLYHHMWSGLRREGSRKEELTNRIHPTQKPVGLLAAILQDYSKIGVIILDSFGGSGSTLIACEKLKRRCFMMEIDEHYCDVIIKRWEDFTGQKAERV